MADSSGRRTSEEITLTEINSFTKQCEDVTSVLNGCIKAERRPRIRSDVPFIFGRIAFENAMMLAERAHACTNRYRGKQSGLRKRWPRMHMRVSRSESKRERTMYRMECSGNPTGEERGAGVHIHQSRFEQTGSASQHTPA